MTRPRDDSHSRVASGACCSATYDCPKQILRDDSPTKVGFEQDPKPLRNNERQINQTVNITIKQECLSKLGVFYSLFHLIEQPMLGTCSAGPRPVSATSFIPKNRSRRTSPSAVSLRLASNRPRYCSSSLPL